MLDNFTPKFLTATGFDSITGRSYEMNANYFATEETAEAVSAEYGTGQIKEIDMLGPGPFGVDTKMIEFLLEDGRWVNAGIVAAYYLRNPPDVADSIIRSTLMLPPAPPKFIPPTIKPITKANTVVEPRTVFGTYPCTGDTNPAGTIIDNPRLSGDEKLIKVIKPGPFGDWQYWIDVN